MKDRNDDNLQVIITAITEKIEQPLKELNEGIGTLKKGLDDVGDKKGKVDKLSVSFENLKKAVTGASSGIKGIAKTGLGILGLNLSLKKIINSGVDAKETMNLFEVSMKNVTDSYRDAEGNAMSFYEKAISFQKELNSSVHTNIVEMSGYQGTFFNMLKNQMDENTAYNLSENLSKATIDMSSLFNIDQKQMASKLQSALTGQATVLRRNGIGIDITQGSLQSTLDNLGIQKSVQNLSYGEKEIARYITILHQAGQAQGDFARTMNQPANQLRILQNEFKNLIQTIGTYMAGLLGKVLPYINGFIMAIARMVKAIANLFGVDLNVTSEQITGGLETVNDEVDGISSGIGGATAAAKEFKKQLMGFDEIHNIEPPTKSSGSGAGGGAGGGNGIDSSLLDALKIADWDLFKNVGELSDKTKEISDNIVNWVKNIVDFVGGVEQALDYIKAIGTGLAAWVIGKPIIDFFGRLIGAGEAARLKVAFGLALGITGTVLMWKGTERLLEDGFTPQTLAETALGMVMGTAGYAMMFNGLGVPLGKSIVIGLGITLAIQGFEVLKHGIKNSNLKEIIAGILESSLGTIAIGVQIAPIFKEGLQKLTKVFDKFKKSTNECGTQLSLFDKTASKAGASLGVTAAGFAGMAVSLGMAYDAGKKFREESEITIGTTIQLGAAIGGATASGALLGSQFGTIGIVIGGVIGLISGAATALFGFANNMKELNEIATNNHLIFNVATEEFNKHEAKMQELIGVYEEGTEAFSTNSTKIDEAKRILAEYVDENGNVQGSVENVQVALDTLNQIMGTNYQVVNGVITDNGKIINSYNELTGSIDNYTDAYILNEAKRLAVEKKSSSLSRIVETKKAYEEAVEAYNRYGEKYTKFINDARASGAIFKSEIQKEIREMGNEYERLGQQVNKTKSEYSEANYDMKTSTEDLTESILYETGVYDYLSKETQQAITEISDAHRAMGDEAQFNLNEVLERTEELKNGTKESAVSIIKDYKQMERETGNSFKNFAGKMNEAFSKAKFDASQKVISGFTLEAIEDFNDLANGPEAFMERMSEMPKETEAQLLLTLTQTYGYQDKYAIAFEDLATKGRDEYNYVLGQLDETTAKEINNVVNELQKKKDGVNSAVDTTMVSPFKQITNKIEAKGKGAQIIQDLSNGISSKVGLVTNSISEIMRRVKSNASVNLWNEGYYASEGFASGMKSAEAIKKIMNAVTSVTNAIPKKMRDILKINSPSKVIAKIAEGVPEGMALGINRDANEVYEAVDNLSEGVLVRTSDINGIANIGANTSVRTQSIADMSTTFTEDYKKDLQQMIISAIKSADVNVQIEAKTEEGVIVKKAVQGIRDYTMQTGEMPFPVLI